jgi:hypothetical protein
MNLNYESLWTVQHLRAGKILWEVRDKKNLIVEDGEKAILETFFRDKDTNYFGMTDFFVGLYNGSLARTSVLTTVPGEPSGNGYARQKIERTSVGFPVIEKDDGDWRVISKELIVIASGGNIGPISGAFLCTSSDNTGTLIAGLSFGVERTVQLGGESLAIQLKIKIM